MARTKGFDEELVLVRIMETFWNRGYQGTSMTMLEEATGLKRQSLYNAFGDKDAMYRAARAQYAVRHAGSLERCLAYPDLIEAISCYFERQLEILESTGTPMGCFFAGGVQDFGTSACELSDIVRTGESEMLRALQDRFEQARRDGQLPDGMTMEGGAAMVFAVSRGVALSARANTGQGVAREAVKACMDLFKRS